jgi:hypothetical protein
MVAVLAMGVGDLSDRGDGVNGESLPPGKSSHHCGKK